MQKLPVLLLSALFSLGVSYEAFAQADIEPTEIDREEAVQTEVDRNLLGWDPLRAASIMGAMDWCLGQANVPDSDRLTYRIVSQGASRALDRFIATEEITSAEAGLVQERVSDQGYYMGIELSAAECNNLKNIASNWAPWELITSRDASFVVEMPSWPEREDIVNTIQGRDFDWILYDAIATRTDNPLLEDEEYYLVGYTKLPQDYLASNSEDEILDAFQEFIFNEMGFPELQDNTQEITPDGVLARVTSGPAYGQTAATIMYIVDDRFYLTLMVGKERLHFERFLRSFEALDLVEETAN